MIQILICVVIVLVVVLMCCASCIHKRNCELREKEKTPHEDEMVEILKQIAIGYGAKPEELNDDDFRESWRTWGNGPHWDFPHECKHKIKGDNIPCTCGHTHDCDM